jgi:hypothetical protein
VSYTGSWEPLVLHLFLKIFVLALCTTCKNCLFKKKKQGKEVGLREKIIIAIIILFYQIFSFQEYYQQNNTD